MKSFKKYDVGHFFISYRVIPAQASLPLKPTVSEVYREIIDYLYGHFMVRVLLVEDHLLMREAWRELILRTGTMSVVGEAESVDEAYRLTTELKPDVLVTDINLRLENGAELVKKVLQTIPDSRIIIVSMNDEISFIKKMFRLGVKGYVTKHSPQKELLEALEKVIGGGTYLCVSSRNLLLESSLLNGKDPVTHLSLRELDIIKLVSKGFGNKEIAGNLGVSLKTVEAHKTRIYKKLRVKSIAELITYGRMKGLDI